MRPRISSSDFAHRDFARHRRCTPRALRTRVISERSERLLTEDYSTFLGVYGAFFVMLSSRFRPILVLLYTFIWAGIRLNQASFIDVDAPVQGPRT